MRTFLLTVSVLIVTQSFCVAQTKSQILQKTYQLASSAKGPEAGKYQRQFFDAFPSDFKSLNKLYGWNNSTDKPAPLYRVSLQHINYFFNLNNINQDSLTKKIIEISNNGKNDADAISYFQSNLITRVLAQKATFIRILKGFTKRDIISVWCFYFDYEDTKARKEAHKKMLQLVGNDKEMARLITNGYYKSVKKNASSH